jgi:hypothetical protein
MIAQPASDIGNSRPFDPCPCIAGGTFHSAKNGAHLSGTDLQLQLFLMLETEPGVLAFQPHDDGMTVEVRHWHGMILAQVLPAAGVARAEALRVKRSHVNNGRRVIMIPESRLRRWPCRDNRRLVAEAGHEPVRVSERAAIVETLLESGGSAPLGDLASLVRSGDPVAAVLSLVSRCVLKVDMETRPIDGRSTVTLFDLLAFEN